MLQHTLGKFGVHISMAPIVQWPAKKIIHHLNVSVKKALITHLDFDVTQK
jgi:hypothetical protein